MLSEDSCVVEVVLVFGGELDLCETCGLLDDGFVKDGIVEGRFVFCGIGVFFGQSFRVGGKGLQDNGEKPVVVLVMVPVSESKFTLARYV